MIYKNTASQKVSVFAYDKTTGAAKTGDAANITAYLSKDWAAAAAVTDTNPTEMDSANMPGWYAFDLTQAETNAEVIVIAPKSATANILLEQVQIFTQDATISSRASQTSVDDIPTVAEFEARTLATADYFDPAADTVANVTTVGSVTGAVGSVTGAVGSVTGNVGGNVAGSVGSVTGAVGSVTGNVGGNVTGSVGSVSAGGITAASIATDAIDADAIAADAVTELQGGLSTLTAQQVWEYVTRELTSAGSGGATAQEVWEYATRALTDKAGFTLHADYDAAKTAASQTSVNDIPTNAELTSALADLPTNAELTSALAAADDAVLAAIAALNNLSSAGAQAAAAAALTAYGAATGAQVTGLSIPTATQVADMVLSRGFANVEDTAEPGSIAEQLMGTFESDITGTTWTIYKSDHVTPFSTRTVTTDENAEPITGVT